MFEKLIEAVFSGVVGNSAYDFLKEFIFKNDDSKETVQPAQAEAKDPDLKTMHGSNPEYINRYRVFSITRDLENVLLLVRNPVAHFVVEDAPSTAWHLSVVVVEDSMTGEWYVFSKGNLAFEGSGGGLAQTEKLFKLLLDKKIPFSAWVINRILSDKLSQGCLTWPAVKRECMPIMAYNKNEYFEKYVTGVYQQLAASLCQI